MIEKPDLYGVRRVILCGGAGTGAMLVPGPPVLLPPYDGLEKRMAMPYPAADKGAATLTRRRS